MKKVGIITFHCADNFGAVLQAYALQKTIQNLNIEAEIIDFRPEALVKPYGHYINFRKHVMEHDFKKVIKSLLAYIYYFIPIEKRKALFNDFRKRYLKMSFNKYYSSKELFDNPPYYDYYIAGSDQIWNPFFVKEIGNSYFLDFVNENSKKISYAASIVESVSDDLIEDYKRYINLFNHISIRENSSLDFVRKITSKEIEVTLDPTLLLTKEEWQKISVKTDIDEKFLFVYDLQYNNELITLANKLSEQTGLKIICYSSGRKYKNAIKSFGHEGPSEFLGYIGNAELILTNSFHGTVFSLVYNKPFYCIPHTIRGSRMIDLLKDLNLEDRIIFKADSLIKLDYGINYNEVSDIIKIKRSDSINFLKIALDIKE